jgi:hypothetical protein
MNELGITLIPAQSPQAKGRVERLWDTLQSRLPVEFKIAGITNIHEANQFLLSYIPKFNENFAVEPANSKVAYTPLREDLFIDNILCFKQIRTIDNGGVFSFKGRHFQPVSNGHTAYIPPKSLVEVLISPVFGVRVKYKKAVYEVVPFIKPKKTKTGIVIMAGRPGKIPVSHFGLCSFGLPPSSFRACFPLLVYQVLFLCP